MKVFLKSTKDELGYEGINSKGYIQNFSGSKNGVSPMESVLLAGAACSSIDIELILQKMRQPLINIEVEVNGIRKENEVPRVFQKIDLHYKLYGKIKEKKAKEAVEKSIEKYCSVLTMLQTTVEISYSFEILNHE